MACSHFDSASLLRVTKVEKALLKLKTQIELFSFTCFQCTRMFPSEFEARQHATLSNHAVFLHFKTGMVSCLCCPSPSADLIPFLKPSVQQDILLLTKSFSSLKPLPNRTATTAKAIPNTSSSLPCGLKNTGNTCFLNACLQMLCHSSGLQSFLDVHHQSVGLVTQTLRQCLVKMSSSNSYSVFNPHLVLSVVSDKGGARHLNDGNQHDAQEFLLFLLSAMEEEASLDGGNNGNVRIPHVRFKNSSFYFPPEYRVVFRTRRSSSSSDEEEVMEEEKAVRPASAAAAAAVNVTKELFQLQLESTVKCDTCNTRSTTRESHSMLSLPVSTQSLSLEECLLTYFSTTDKFLLNQQNGYFCEKCRTKRNATRSLKIVGVGDLLLLHLKRFSNRGEKLTQSVVVNEELHVSDDDDGFFELVGIVEHYGGTLTKGHYVAQLRGRGSFSDSYIRCSDEQVEANKSAAATKGNAQVYLALYQRA